MKALVLGSTGLTGSYLTQLLLEKPNIEEVHVLVRRAIAWSHPKLHVHLVNLEKTELPNINPDLAFCCLGTTIKKAGSQEAFWKVDVEIPTNYAKKLFELGTPNFVLLTAMGASEKSRIFYNRAKGAVENKIISIGFSSCSVVRPSMLLGDRAEKRSMEKLAQRLMQVFSFLIPKKYKAVDSKDVANCMLRVALEEKEGNRIIENDLIPA